jgi:nucleotide-binding universal stress UspA family protein
MTTLFSEEVSGMQIPMVEATPSVLPPYGQYDAIEQANNAGMLGLTPNPDIQQPFQFEPLMANQPSSIVGGMFSPEISRAAEMEYLQKRQAAMRDRALAFAQLSPMQQADYGFYRGGQQLGDVVGGALGGQDPQLRMIGLQQQILSELDPSDPEQQLRVAQKYAQTAPELAAKIADNARKAQFQMASTAQKLREKQGVDPFQQIIRSGKYTPASLAKYQSSGNVADLELIEKVKDDVVVVGNALVSKSTGKPIYQGEKPEKYSAFAQELIDAGLNPGTEPFERRMLDYINEKTKGAGKGTGNVTIGGITIDTGAASKAAGKIVGENVANIENQYSLLTGVGDALKLIDKGIYAGAYGPEKGFIAKFSGGVIGDSKKVQNTEVFMSNIGEIVIPRLIQFGGNDSNEELKYLQKVVAGDQRIEPESMKRILASAEKKIRNNIARLQKQVEAGGTGSQLPIEPIETPSAIPKPTKRYNPQTKKLEVVTGE